MINEYIPYKQGKRIDANQYLRTKIKNDLVEKSVKMSTCIHHHSNVTH